MTKDVGTVFTDTNGSGIRCFAMLIGTAIVMIWVLYLAHYVWWAMHLLFGYLPIRSLSRYVPLRWNIWRFVLAFRRLMYAVAPTRPWVSIIWGSKFHEDNQSAIALAKNVGINRGCVILTIDTKRKWNQRCDTPLRHFAWVDYRFASQASLLQDPSIFDRIGRH